MAIDDILFELEEHMEKALEHLRHELRGLRTGRASPALVEYLKVDYYGSPTDLKSIASISIPEASQILIKPFSPQDLKSIERAISESSLGLSPQSDGKTLRLKLPPMSQERRQKMSGQVKEFGEAAKIAGRNSRRDANKHVEQEEKAGGITEDQAKSAKEQVNDAIHVFEGKVDEMIEHKKKEIMEV